MTQLISIFFVVLALIIFIAMIGLPVWIIYYLIKQYRKNKKLSLFQIFLALIVGLMLLNFLKGLAGFSLENIQQNFGVNSLNN